MIKAKWQGQLFMWMWVILVALGITAGMFVAWVVMVKILGHSELGALGMIGFIGLFVMRFFVVKKHDDPHE